MAKVKQNFYPDEMISPDEAARRMGCGRQKIETGIRNKEFPFGSASQNENGRWRYFIPRAAFEHWMKYGNVPVVTDPLHQSSTVRYSATPKDSIA